MEELRSINLLGKALGEQLEVGTGHGYAPTKDP